MEFAKVYRWQKYNTYSENNKKSSAGYAKARQEMNVETDQMELKHGKHVGFK